MPILTLEKNGSIREMSLGIMGGVVMLKRCTIEDAQFFCPHLEEVHFAVYVMCDRCPQTTILKGGYVTPFYTYLNKHFPGWKLKAA